MNTSIQDILKFVKHVPKYSNNIERFFDNDNDIEDRIEAYTLLDSHEQLEIISDLCSLYQYTKTDTNNKLLRGVCNNKDIDITIKNLILGVFEDEFELKLQILETSENKFNINIFFDIFKRIIEDNMYIKNKERINNIIKYVSNRNKTEDYFYKIYKNVVYFKDNKCSEEFYKELFINSKGKTKILCADALKTKISEEYIINEITKFCDTIINNDILLADAADILIRWGYNAEKYFQKLSGMTDTDTLFENKENAHIFSTNENIDKFINFLSNISINKVEEHELFLKYKEKYNISKNIEITLSRIYVDQATYKGYSLITIFLKICKSIEQHIHREELEKRVIEELEEMSGTCSSGHLIRLANIFNGFDLELNISIQEEFKYKFKHILMKEIENNENCEELIIDIENMRIFLMKNMDKIFNILWNDYKQMNKTDFEDMFRKEYMNYEQIN